MHCRYIIELPCFSWCNYNYLEEIKPIFAVLWYFTTLKGLITCSVTQCISELPQHQAPPHVCWGKHSCFPFISTIFTHYFLSLSLILSQRGRNHPQIPVKNLISNIKVSHYFPKTGSEIWHHIYDSHSSNTLDRMQCHGHGNIFQFAYTNIK